MRRFEIYSRVVRAPPAQGKRVTMRKTKAVSFLLCEDQSMDVSGTLIYSIAQPALNILFGFLFGFFLEQLPFRRLFMLWVALVVFVSVRVVGDWLFQQPSVLPWETVRLYVYATCFFFGTVGARWLVGIYNANKLLKDKEL